MNPPEPDPPPSPDAAEPGDEHARIELEDRLRAAAYAGHAPSRAALGDLPVGPPEDLRDWVLGLEAFGIAPCLRAAVAAAEVLLEARDRGVVPREQVAITRQAILAARGYLDCPCAEHERAARKGWTRDAPWSYEFSWADVAAEVAWAAHWATSEAQVRSRIEASVLAWALPERAG